MGNALRLYSLAARDRCDPGRTLPGRVLRFGSSLNALEYPAAGYFEAKYVDAGHDGPCDLLGRTVFDGRARPAAGSEPLLDNDCRHHHPLRVTGLYCRLSIRRRRRFASWWMERIVRT